MTRPALFGEGERVTWQEGKLARPKVGVIEVVHELQGLQPTYTVRVLRLDDSVSRITQTRHHSELDPVEPGLRPLTAEELKARIQDVQATLRRKIG